MKKVGQLRMGRMQMALPGSLHPSVHLTADTEPHHNDLSWQPSANM